MILERVEKGDLVKSIYESSNIIASTYNKTNNNLNVIFKNGGSYTYLGVSATDYMRFETADSQGKILNSKIKGYEFLKGDKVDPELIIKRIKRIKAEELVKYETTMFDFMSEAIKDFETNGAADMSMLNQITKMITKYKEMRD